MLNISDGVSRLGLASRRIFVSLGFGLDGFQSRLDVGLEGRRSRDFEYCKEMAW